METENCSICHISNCNFITRCDHCFHLNCFKRFWVIDSQCRVCHRMTSCNPIIEKILRNDETSPEDFNDLDLDLIIEFMETIEKDNFEISEECMLALLVRMITVRASKSLQWSLLNRAFESRKLNLLIAVFKLLDFDYEKTVVDENMRIVMNIADTLSRAEIIRLILDEMGKETENPFEFISFALKTGNLEFIDQLICANAAISGLLKSEYTKLPVLQRIFELGPLVKGAEGFTMLHAACASGNFDMVKLFVESGQDVHANSYAGTMIHAAATGGNLDTFNFLIDMRVDYSQHSVTPLIFAVYFEHLNICKQIIELNLCDINATYGENNFTALHLACSKPLPDFAKILLDAGADIELEDSEGFTAVSYAFSNEDIDILKHPRLLPKNWIEASKRCPPEIVKIYIEDGLDLKTLDEKGRNGLFYIAEHLVIENITEIIEKQGIDVNTVDSDGINPLQVACEVEDVNHVLQFRNTNMRDKNGRTAVHYACLNYSNIYPEFIDLALLNQCDNDGNNALHLTAQTAYCFGAEELLYEGMDPLVKNNAGKTALDIAKETGNLSTHAFIECWINNHPNINQN